MGKRKRWHELSSQLPNNKPLVGVEVGVWCGQMMAWMLNHCPRLTLYGVDSWHPYPPDSTYAQSGDNISKASQAKFDGVKIRAHEAVARFGKRAILVEADSVEAAGRFDDESLDYVFIDANHSYEAVYRDIRAWWPKVKLGGLVSGHDYAHEKFPNFGVDRAVDEFLQRKPETGEDHTWFTVKEPLYKIAGVAFGEKFQPLVQAFERSAEANAANAEIEIIEGNTPARLPKYENKWVDNNYKLHLWQDAVHATNKPLVLMDTDTIILEDLWDAFVNHEFDVAITERPHPSWFNGGVVFLRPTPAARRFFDRWVDWNDKLYADLPALIAARKKHWGMNQTALVQMLETEGAGDCNLLKLPCATWNNCDATWKDFDPDTCRVLHVKSELQRAVLKGRKPAQIRIGMREAAQAYYRYAEAM